MRHLQTIDPIKGLKNSLNFLKYKSQPVLQILHLANTINCTPAAPASKSSLDGISLEQIYALKPTQSITDKDLNELKFQAHVHRNSNLHEPIGSIYEQLSKHQKRLVWSMLKFSDKLSTRQLQYLHYSLRRKMYNLYPNWQNLHFNPDSPMRRQFLILPTISDIQHIESIKLLPKKKLLPVLASLRPQKEAPAEAAPAPVEDKKAKGKGKA